MYNLTFTLYFLNEGFDNPMARVISSSEEDLALASRQLKMGGLISFPTETVYGLGSRLADESLKKIFIAKNRPYSDPIIVHFATPNAARQLLILTPTEDEMFKALAAKFMPGPLTIIGRAHPSVPPLVMAGTGCVGLRVPSHPIAHRFLEVCGEPVAAPSANRFSHVSPTTVSHVMNDLGHITGLLVVSGGISTIGIESTIVKITGDSLMILRPGFITETMIEEVLPGRLKKTDNFTASPGHELKHYSQVIPTFLLQKGGDNAQEVITPNDVLVDFGGLFADYANRVSRYFDLSPTGSIIEAINRTYQILREAEETPNAERCFIADVLVAHTSEFPIDRERANSLHDRLLRSSAHQIRSIAE